MILSVLLPMAGWLQMTVVKVAVVATSGSTAGGQTGPLLSEYDVTGELHAPPAARTDELRPQRLTPNHALHNETVEACVHPLALPCLEPAAVCCATPPSTARRLPPPPPEHVIGMQPPWSRRCLH